jgi:DNA-binding MarR family transcriptional regulator
VLALPAKTRASPDSWERQAGELTRTKAAQVLYGRLAESVSYNQQVAQEKNLDFQLQECLTRLGMASPVEWDVLAFVYRHQASLTNADQIARMLGYASTVVADALDHLESLKLIRRSRASQGMRLYQCVTSEADPLSDSCFQQLITLAENPAGRLLLITKLRPPRAGLSPGKKKGKND